MAVARQDPAGEEAGQPPRRASGGHQLKLTAAALAGQQVAAGQQRLEVSNRLYNRSGKSILKKHFNTLRQLFNFGSEILLLYQAKTFALS